MISLDLDLTLRGAEIFDEDKQIALKLTSRLLVLECSDKRGL